LTVPAPIAESPEVTTKPGDETHEKVAGAPGSETPVAGAGSDTAPPGTPSGPLAAVAAVEPAHDVIPPASELPVVAIAVGPGEVLARAGSRAAAAGESAVAGANALLVGLGCSITSLRSPGGCGTGLLPVQSLGIGSTVLAATSGGTAAAGGASDNDHGGSVGGGRPVEPTPGPAPGGASGSSAAGGSGLALSGLLTLAGLLGLAAPRALRRLRLSSEPWLSASFALIPERPD
jgi:hypothetical protein